MSNSGFERTGIQYIIDDSPVNEAVDRINKRIDELGKRGPAAAKLISAALEQFGASANIAFNEKLGRYVDLSTKKIISNAQAVQQATAATRALAQQVEL